MLSGSILSATKKLAKQVPNKKANMTSTDKKGTGY